MKLELISRLPEEPSGKPPLLFLHGMGVGAWCWEEHFLPWFAQQGYPAYAMSLRGHGQSDGHDKLRWTSLEAFVADLAQIYESMKQPPVVIGHSMGGFIVQKFLAEYSFRPGQQPPAAIFLASVPSNGILGIALHTLLRFPLPALRVMLTLSTRPLLSTPDILQKTLLSTSVPRESLETWSALTGEESLRAFSTLLVASSPARMENPPPLLTIGAENDAYISLQDVKNTARYYSSDCKIIPGLAHLAMLDTEWESCAGVIAEWLGEQGL